VSAHNPRRVASEAATHKTNKTAIFNRRGM